MAGQVRRYHTWPVRQQTVGEHTWHVMRLYCRLFGSPRPEVWEYLLYHDAPEVEAGDIPFHAKRRNPRLKAASDESCDAEAVHLGINWPELTVLERVRFKLCDLLEMHEFGCEELYSGNKFALRIRADVRDAVMLHLDNLAVVAPPKVAAVDRKAVEAHIALTEMEYGIEQH